MKRTQSATLLAALVLFTATMCGCISPRSSVPRTSFDEDVPVSIPPGIETNSVIERESLTTVEELLEATELVIVGTVEDSLGAVECQKNESDLFQDVPYEEFTIYPVPVRVDEVIWPDEASVQVSETICIDTVSGPPCRRDWSDSVFSKSGSRSELSDDHFVSGERRQ